MAAITLKTGKKQNKKSSGAKKVKAHKMRTSVPVSVIRRAVEKAYRTPLTEEELQAPTVNVIVTRRMPTPKRNCY